MTRYYLAVDIGASSGRHMLASIENGKMVLEEVYRFQNGMEKRDGTLCWNWERLFSEIKNGLKRCREIGKIPVTMGIDTWGVDFVLLDRKDRILGDHVGYRDKRTKGMEQKLQRFLSQEELYRRTGIQKQSYNTIYQLLAVQEQHPEQLKEAASILMSPDYFHFLLTGKKKMEYTIASTSQMLAISNNDWDRELLELLGLPSEIFCGVSMPGTAVGNFTEEVQREVGFDCTVVLPPSHDTASAVLAVPAEHDDAVYISSGTWSLMGIERKTADCSLQSMKINFTNEGGYDHRYRYLKNIMGLWMIQSVKKELTEELSFAEICARAEQASISSIVDCNADCFLAPESMWEAVCEFCKATGQQVPKDIGEMASVIYRSLAKCYADTLAEIEERTGHRTERIYVVGGGANADYLNRLTAAYTNCEVSAGPTEATAIGNVTVQMLYDGVFESIEKARACIGESFEIRKYSPSGREKR